MWLKQSTSVVISFGPFVDKTDGVTLEVGLVSALDHASTGIFLSKNGGALTIRNATVTASTYDAYGNYRVTLNTTDTGTLGTLRVQFSEAATCLPVWQDFMVVPANVYDSIIGGSDNLQVDTIQWLGTACATPTTNGVPEVDVTHVSGTSQTAGDVCGKLGTPTDLGGGATISANLVDIEGQTDDIGAAGAGLTAIPWNSSWDTEVQSEANDAIVANGLDHIVAASVAGTDIVDNSIIAKMVSKSATADWDSFVNTTDALESIRDKETDIETDTAEIGTAGAGLTVLATQASVNTIDDFLDTEIGTLLTESQSHPTLAEIEASTVLAKEASLLTDKAGYSLSAAGIDAILDEICESEGAYTLRQIMSIGLAVLSGITTNGGLTFKTPDGSTIRVVATVDSNGNRTNMTLTP